MAAGLAAALGFAAPASAGPTLDKVKQAGALSCGVPTGVPGFAQHYGRVVPSISRGIARAGPAAADLKRAVERYIAEIRSAA